MIGSADCPPAWPPPGPGCAASRSTCSPPPGTRRPGRSAWFRHRAASGLRRSAGRQVPRRGRHRARRQRRRGHQADTSRPFPPGGRRVRRRHARRPAQCTSPLPRWTRRTADDRPQCGPPAGGGGSHLGAQALGRFAAEIPRRPAGRRGAVAGAFRHRHYRGRDQLRRLARRRSHRRSVPVRGPARRARRRATRRSGTPRSGPPTFRQIGTVAEAAPSSGRPGPRARRCRDPAIRRTS